MWRFVVFIVLVAWVRRVQIFTTPWTAASQAFLSVLHYQFRCPSIVKNLVRSPCLATVSLDI